MRYSEAIRLSGTVFKQEFGWSGDGHATACANQGAKSVVGNLSNIEAVFPIANEPFTCPICKVDKKETLAYVVANCLNDKHRLSFSQIADIVEQFENELEAKKQAKQIEVMA